MFKRLSFALAAVAAVLVLAVVLPALFGSDRDLLPLPRLISAAGTGSQSVPQGLLASADLTLTTDLPDAPAEALVYRATAAPLSTTPEEALAWARDFGLPDPQVYRDPREPEAIFVLGSDDRQLTFRQFGPMGSIDYGTDAAAAAVEGTPLPFDRAAEVAVTFLREHDLLPAAYRVEEPEDFAPQPERPIRFVHIVPELDGHPLVGDRAGIHVAVNPAGEVTYVSFNSITFERDETYPIKSAQEAYEELTGGQVAGSPFRLVTDVRHPAEKDVQHYRPDPPAYTTGDPVTVTGWGHVLVAEDGGDVRAQLMAWGSASYDLIGPRLAELSDVGFDDVQIQGTIVAQMGPNRWQVEMTDWRTAPPRKSHCLVGTFTLDGSDAWLVTEPVLSAAEGKGERYRLPNPPDELSDGERIEVCADERSAEGDALHWWSITSPPMSAGEGYVSSSSGSVVVVVEVPVEETLPATPTPVGAAEAPVGIPNAETPFEIGQQVEITGVVHATIFVNGETRRIEALLYLDEQRGQSLCSLSGPPDMLEAIAQLDRLHVRVRGQAVANTTEIWTPGELGIEIEEFEKVWPDERVQGFLGHLDLETLEGREVVVFTDHETDQRYVLASSLETGGSGWVTSGDSILNYEQVFVTGVVQLEETYAGLPVLQQSGMHKDSQTDAATSADEIPLDIPQVVDESRFPPGRGELQGTFVVDRVELAYYYEPQPGYVARSMDGRSPTQESPEATIVQPVWVFYGHNADDITHFVAYAQAIVEEHVQNATP